MKRMALGMVCASALACANPARCDDPAQEPGQLFQSLDKNGDSTLGPDEIGEDRRRFFERLVRVGDKNDDKKLSREEFVAAMSEEEKPVDSPRPRFGGDRPSPGQMFQRLDRNSDGKFTKEEIPDQTPIREWMERIFTSAEKTEFIREEFEAAVAKQGPPGGRRPGGESDRPRPEGGDRGPRPGEGGPRPEGRDMAREGDRRPGPPREAGPPGRPEGDRGDRMEARDFRDRRPVPHLIRVLDRDDNGKLNRREIARIAERFEEFDRNSDGELDGAELGVPSFGGGFPPFGGRPGFGPGPEGPRREGGERDREMARDTDRRPGPSGGALDRERDRPRPEGPPEVDRRPEGPREGDHPRPEGPRDGDRPRPEGRPDGPPRGERGPGRDGGRPLDLFARLDKDSDGSISKEEAPERMKERFKDLDRNSDGKITSEEFREAIAREFGAPVERRERRPESDN